MNGVETDVHFMKQALRLAAKGRGTTSPNPMVGAILVKNGRIVGKGYHRRAGAPHAEILALQQAGSRSHGATLYVTLEPCSHTGKRTPPCVPAIITARPRRVVVALRDPNPHVNGQGIRRLRQTGLTVDIGCLQEEAKHLNEAYVHWVKTGRPFVILKAAMTLDGKIATASGESKWITGAKARLHVHRLRSQVDAIMVGIGTVLKDDPQLTARLPEKDRLTALRQPVRIVLDSRLRIPLSAHLLEHLKKCPTIIATTREAPKRKIEKLRTRGAGIFLLPKQGGHVSLQACLQRLGQMGVTSVLVEGGSEVNASLLQGGFVNRVVLFVAPTLLGGREAKGLVGGHSPKHLVERLAVSDVKIQRVGEDFLITGNLSP